MRVWSVDGNFYGRMMVVVSLSVDLESRDNYGLYVLFIGVRYLSMGKVIRYGSVEDVEEIFGEFGKEMVVFIIEFI